MAGISATQVMQLRDQTGQAMMDCKRALIETAGDMEKAIDLLRKKGMAVMEKRGGRDTKEGRIVGEISPDGKKAVLAMLCSETDFTSKNEDFQNAAQILGQTLLAADQVPDSSEGVEALDAGDGKKVGDVVNEIISKTGEKITIGDYVRFELPGPGLLKCYVHFNQKVGTILQVDAENEQAAQHDAVKQLINDLTLHITAANPIAVSRDDVDPALLAHEKEIAAGQAEGKPENIIEKIVTGKINKWFQQVALLEQPFVKDDSKSVTQMLDETAQTAGGKLSVKQFRRFQIG